jgi:DUF4097 and DUF4098 domain-containing protein YvlB
MRRLRLWPVYAILTVLAVLPAAGCAFDNGRVSEDFHATVPQAPASIEVHNAVGGIEIIAWDKPSVEIDARKWGNSVDDVRAITISVQPGASALVVTSHFPTKSTHCRVEYTIHAPTKANLNLEESVGGIKSSGFTGDARESTSTGGVAASMAAVGGAQRIALHVSVGAIALQIPAQSSATISASTSVGPIKADFPLSFTQHFVGSTATGSIGKGDARVELTTSTGAIAIQRE